MNIKTMFVFLAAALMLVGSVSAAGLSIQLKRTNPGIAGEKSAELIFDIVNTDLNNKIEGFLWCRSPDDSVISSVQGIGTGSGAQYVGPKFYMDLGPSQRAMSLTLEADSPGDKRTGCTVKYAPYTEEVLEGDTKTTNINYEGTIGKTETDISRFKVKLLEYTPALQSENTTTTEKVKISVNEIPKEIEVGSSATISSLTVRVLNATEDSADVKITGQLTSSESTSLKKLYLKMNGDYVSSLTDDQYREIRLDKTVPFVDKSFKNPECPEDKPSCKKSEVIDLGTAGKIPVVWVVVAITLVILIVVYLLGRTSRKD